MATLTMLEQAPTPKSENRSPLDLHDLTTETANTASEGLDTKSALEIARIINHEDAKIAAAVKKALPEIAIESLNVATAVSLLGDDSDEASWSAFDSYHRAALRRLERSGAEFAVIA